MKEILNGQEPIRSTKSSFVEKWGRAEEANAYMGLSLFIVGTVCVGLIAALAYLILRPQPVYYVPGARTAGIARPNQIEESSLKSFAESWILNWANFTPATIKDMYQQAAKYMSPGLLSKMQARIDDEIQKIERNSISSLFTASQSLVKEESRGYEVIVTGEKTIFIGKENMDKQRVKYILKIKLTAPTEKNIYGLMIEALDQTPLEQ